MKKRSRRFLSGLLMAIGLLVFVAMVLLIPAAGRPGTVVALIGEVTDPKLCMLGGLGIFLFFLGVTVTKIPATVESTG